MKQIAVRIGGFVVNAINQSSINQANKQSIKQAGAAAQVTYSFNKIFLDILSFFSSFHVVKGKHEEDIRFGNVMGALSIQKP